MTIESVIPQHLQTERTQGTRRPNGYTPPYPCFTGRYDPSVTQVAMAYYGVQFQGSTPPESVRSALAELDKAAGASDGPGHWDRARYVDEAGYTNIVSMLYWDDPATWQAWRASAPAWVDEERLSPEAGYFLEVATPTAERFETLFSNDRREGVAVISEGLSGEVLEHAYWGSMRDRIPASQTDALAPSGAVSRTQEGNIIRVRPGGNVTLIRSGKEWTEAEGDERRMILEDILPVLRDGMDFLRDDGRSIGCYANRYMRVVDENLQEVDKAFGMSWWHSLGELEAWAEHHETHKAIFGAAMRYLSTVGPAAKLRLYHEVTVAEPDQAEFSYIGCHPSTGMLRA
jgi:aldoxime dehydratase